MNWAWYRAGRVVTRFIIFCTMRVRKRGADIPERPGGYVLAVSHQGHLDPFLAGSFQDRPVVWMTRREFFRYGWARWLIRKFNGFEVNRQGVPVSSIRYAIRQARAGEVIGICPEGAWRAGRRHVFGAVGSSGGSARWRSVPGAGSAVRDPGVVAAAPGRPLAAGQARAAVGSVRGADRAAGGRAEHAAEPGGDGEADRGAYVALYDEMVRTMAVDMRWVA